MNIIMECCLHENSPKKDWLPIKNGVLRLHPYCKKCGVVKDTSSDSGKRLGYFVNSLYKLKTYLDSRGYKLSQAQIRLILMEFEKKGYADTYSMSFSHQKEVFIKIVKKYVKVSEDVIREFI